MPRGNRIDISSKVNNFQEVKSNLDQFLRNIQGIDTVTDLQKQWCYEYAIIKLYCAFEELMLEALKAALNNDASHFLEKNNITQITHLNRDVAEYVIVGDGYFNFKGRDGLIKTLRTYLPKDHWLIKIVKYRKYKVSLNRLSAFRNYAAHGGDKAKARAKASAKPDPGGDCMGSSGAWLSSYNGTRYTEIAEKIYKLSGSIRRQIEKENE